MSARRKARSELARSSPRGPPRPAAAAAGRAPRDAAPAAAPVAGVAGVAAAVAGVDAVDAGAAAPRPASGVTVAAPSRMSFGSNGPGLGMVATSSMFFAATPALRAAGFKDTRRT